MNVAGEKKCLTRVTKLATFVFMNDSDGYYGGRDSGWPDHMDPIGPDDEGPTEEIAVTCEFCKAQFTCLKSAEYHDCPEDKP